MVPRPIQVQLPNGISIGSAVLQGLRSLQTDIPTDHAIPCVAIDRIY